MVLKVPFIPLEIHLPLLGTLIDNYELQCLYAQNGIGVGAGRGGGAGVGGCGVKPGHETEPARNYLPP